MVPLLTDSSACAFRYRFLLRRSEGSRNRELVGSFTSTPNLSARRLYLSFSFSIASLLTGGSSSTTWMPFLFLFGLGCGASGVLSLLPRSEVTSILASPKTIEGAWATSASIPSRRHKSTLFDCIPRSDSWVTEGAALLAQIHATPDFVQSPGSLQGMQTSWSRCHCNCYIVDASLLHSTNNSWMARLFTDHNQSPDDSLNSCTLQLECTTSNVVSWESTGPNMISCLWSVSSQFCSSTWFSLIWEKVAKQVDSIWLQFHLHPHLSNSQKGFWMQQKQTYTKYFVPTCGHQHVTFISISNDVTTELRKYQKD